MPQPSSSLLQRVLAALPEAPARVPNGLHSFFYHTVSDRPLAHARHLYGYKSAAQFERDLVWLKSRFTLVAHADVARHLRGERALPANAAQVSFDDGLAECFDVARPLLLKHGVPCTFFVVRDLVDNARLMHKSAVSLCLDVLERASEADFGALAARAGSALGARFDSREELAAALRALSIRDEARMHAVCEALGVREDVVLRERPYMTSEQIRQLAGEGFTIGGHTTRHAELDLLDRAAVEREIVESCAFVRDLTGQREVPFAITFNGLRLPRAPLRDLLARHPFIDTIYDTNDLMADAPFVVNRIWADTPAGAEQETNLPFLLKRAKALEPARRLKRTLQRLPR
ncbi:MAG: polysaccharide deacetylase family protein [Deltaproteobacteria bacterium]|nr:polysaccharide deacetylase family protein [Deltaproteobacteria bacterium]